MEDHRALLDCGASVRAIFADDVEIEVIELEARNRSRRETRAGRGIGAHRCGYFAFLRRLWSHSDSYGRTPGIRAGRNRRKTARCGSEVRVRRARFCEFFESGFNCSQPGRAGKTPCARIGTRARNSRLERN